MNNFNFPSMDNAFLVLLQSHSLWTSGILAIKWIHGEVMLHVSKLPNFIQFFDLLTFPKKGLPLMYGEGYFCGCVIVAGRVTRMEVIFMGKVAF